MKKIYSTLSMLVAGAVVASAATTMLDATKFNNFRAPKKINQELMLKRAANPESTTRMRVFDPNIDVNNIGGTYVNVYENMFEGYLEMARSIKMEIVDLGDGKVDLPGLANWSRSTRGVSWYQNIQGEIKDGKIVCPLGQVLGTYAYNGTVYDIYLVKATYSEEGATVEKEGDLEFTIGAKKIECGNVAVGTMLGDLGWWDGQFAPQIIKPNASISYEEYEDIWNPTSAVYASYTVPMYVEFIEDELGSDCMMTSLMEEGGYVLDVAYEDGVLYFSDANAESIVYGYDDNGDYLIDEATYDAVFVAEVLDEEATDEAGKDVYVWEPCVADSEFYGGVSDDQKEITLPIGGFETTSGDAYDWNMWAVWALGKNGNKGYYNGFYNPTKIVSYDIVGVQNVAADNVDNSNAPVEYFNLQGARVNSPAAGQVVIRRQGSDVKKMVVR